MHSLDIIWLFPMQSMKVFWWLCNFNFLRKPQIWYLPYYVVSTIYIQLPSVCRLFLVVSAIIPLYLLYNWLYWCSLNTWQMVFLLFFCNYTLDCQHLIASRAKICHHTHSQWVYLCSWLNTKSISLKSFGPNFMAKLSI